MRIVLCHNYYQQRGGEDQSFEDEAELLEARGHRVIRHTVHNDALQQQSRVWQAVNTVWNRQSHRRLLAVLQSEEPDLVHCTNIFPQLSPSIYFAAESAGVPVVQALRNYRLLCPAFSLLRDGQVCEDCAMRRFAWPSIAHGCYRESRLASAVVATSNAVHHLLRTWSSRIKLYYTLTEFARQKFVAAGIPGERILVKSNSVSPDLGPGSGQGGYAIFVGRLSVEKGIQTLLEAWREMPGQFSLRIVGDGPLAGAVEAAARKDRRILWLGSRPLPETLRLIGDAACLICPSIWFETFGRVIAEAYCMGTPVVASRLGAMAELVTEANGELFQVASASDLAAKVTRLVSDPERLVNMRRSARLTYESHFTPSHNYKRLMEIYELALGRQTESGSVHT